MRNCGARGSETSPLSPSPLAIEPPDCTPHQAPDPEHESRCPACGKRLLADYCAKCRLTLRPPFACDCIECQIGRGGAEAEGRSGYSDGLSE